MICPFEYVCQLLFSFKIFLKSINNTQFTAYSCQYCYIIKNVLEGNFLELTTYFRLLRHHHSPRVLHVYCK